MDTRSKKFFLSYKFTGEDIAELTETLSKILATLRALGHKVYCSIEDEKSFQENLKTNKEILHHTLNHLDDSDLIFAFVRSEQKSEGMLIEVGYALAKGKPFVLAIQNGIKTTFLTEIANTLIEFESVNDLCEKLKEVNF